MRRYGLVFILLGTLLYAKNISESAQAKEKADALMASIRSVTPLQADTEIENPYIGARKSHKRLAVRSRPKPPTFGLQGILNTKALINGSVYQVGDRIEGFVLQTVTEKGITLTKNGRTYSLVLHHPSGTIQIERDEP